MSQEDDKNRIVRVRDRETDSKASDFDDWLHDNDYCFTVYENVNDRGWMGITVEADEDHAQIKDRIDKGYRLVIEEGE